MKKLLKVVVALVLAAALFTGGYLAAYGRLAGVEALLEESPAEWFAEKSAIFLDPERINPLDVQTFNRVLKIMDEDYYEEIGLDSLMNSAAKGIAQGADDPYTNYYNAEEMKQYMEQASGNYIGIGVTVSMDDTNLLTVNGVFDGSPAQGAGIRKDDKIISVDGTDVTEMDSADEIVKMIKGEADTAVKIMVYRPATKERLDFDLIRKVINEVNVESRLMDDGIGYIWIKQFDNDVSRDFYDQYVALQKQGMKKLVIDLRDNPGGDYYEVIDIADMLLPEGLIVYTMDRAGNREEKRSEASQFTEPLAILVNGYSASASEILSASVQDHDRGVLIGEKTFGKGIVQTIDTSMPNGGGISFTSASYYTPNGVCIHGVGIEPDIEVVTREEYLYVLPDEIPADKDDVLNRAIAELMEK